MILILLKRKYDFIFSFDCVKNISFIPSINFRLQLKRISSSKTYVPPLNNDTQQLLRNDTAALIAEEIHTNVDDLLTVFIDVNVIRAEIK